MHTCVQESFGNLKNGQTVIAHYYSELHTFQKKKKLRKQITTCERKVLPLSNAPEHKLHFAMSSFLITCLIRHIPRSQDQEDINFYMRQKLGL